MLYVIVATQVVRALDVILGQKLKQKKACIKQAAFLMAASVHGIIAVNTHSVKEDS